jgi:nitrogen fixation/metabolism regulation signal transduction histidine kinase
MLRALGLPGRALLLVAVTLGLAVGGQAVLVPWVAWPAAALASALLAMRLFAPPAAASRAVADAMLSYLERDYSVRLAAQRADDPSGLVERLNALGDALRTTHNDVYQKEMLLETVLKATPTAILLENERGRVVYANGTARELFGDGKPLEGQRFADLTAAAPAELREALAAPDDALVSVELEGEPQVFDVARRFFHINTQQHRLVMIRPLGRELERREAEAWKKAIRVMSHELNNSLAPVASLVHSARQLLGVPTGAARLQSVFDTIEERTAHLRQFLDGFARFARLPRPVIAAVDVRSFMQVVQALYPFRIDGGLPDGPAHFDASQLQQVLINLVKNAVEAGSASEDIVVGVRREAGGLRFEVADRGTGMSEEVRRHALLPFYSTKKTGSGLGLSLCREIVEAHGGRLGLRGRDGGGTLVEIWLPEPG